MRSFLLIKMRAFRTSGAPEQHEWTRSILRKAGRPVAAVGRLEWSKIRRRRESLDPSARK